MIILKIKKSRKPSKINGFQLFYNYFKNVMINADNRT